MLLYSDSVSGATTGTSYSDTIKTTVETMYLLVDTTAITAGTLDIEVQWSIDGNTWYSYSTPDDLAQITGTGETWLGALPARAPFMRLAYVVVTGPVTFDLAVSGF